MNRDEITTEILEITNSYCMSKEDTDKLVDLFASFFALQYAQFMPPILAKQLQSVLECQDTDA